MSGAPRVLVVDDEPGIREAVRQVLEYEGFEVHVAGSGGEALTVYPGLRPDVVLLDVKMAGLDGLDTLGRLRQLDPTARVIMISGHGTIATAVRAAREGAFDFIEKPLDADRVLVTVRNAVAQAALATENTRLREEVRGPQQIVGKSEAIRALLDVIARVGPTPARVLITGENGSGKELVAQGLHEASPRAAAPFIEVNCAAIPSELIESELFGHVKGSFTGAVTDHAGKFELANGGTLFLDEVGDMSLAAQAKVLRVLQEGLVTRIGGSQPIRADVRVIAATNKHIETEIAEGRFREDLYYRLNVVPIEVPPLRARREDIPLLVEHFRTRLVALGARERRFASDAIADLCQRPWPGNVRELRNAVERLLILAPESVVTAVDVARLLPEGSSVAGGGAGSGGGRRNEALLDVATFDEFKQQAERTYLVSKLREHDWNVAETARALDMPRSNLYKKIERYGLTRE